MTLLSVIGAAALAAVATWSLADGGESSSLGKSADESSAEALAFAEEQEPQYLFVQSAEEATYSQDPEQAPTLTLHGVPSTVWFTERPERDVGQTPTAQFIEGWSAEGFDIDPPNAALEFKDSEGRSSVVIVSLSDPEFDLVTGNVTYTITPLSTTSGGPAIFGNTGAEPSIPTDLGAVTLFIDSALTRSLPGVGYFYGVDITRSGLSSENVLPLPLFDFSDDDYNEVTIGDTTYHLPSTLLYDGTDTFSTHTESYSSITEMTEALSVSAGIEYSSPVVSADVSATYSQQQSTANSSYFVLIDAVDRKYRLKAGPGASTSDAFNNAIDALPETYDGDSQEEYFKLFSTYGTHYVYSVDYGGILHYWSQESDTSSMTQEEFEVAVSTKVKAIAGSVSGDIEVSGSSSSSVDTSNVVVSMKGAGGDATSLGLYQSDSDDQNFNEWWGSIDANPGMMSSKYHPIYDLVTGSKATELRHALDDYLRADLGYQVTLSVNKDGTYQSSIALGTDNESTAEVDFPTKDDLTQGGLLVVADAKTGGIVDTLTIGEAGTTVTFQQSIRNLNNLAFTWGSGGIQKAPSTTPTNYESDKLGATPVNEIAKTIHSYESEGKDYLYYVAMITPIENDQQPSYTWFERIGGPAFTSLPNTSEPIIYILLGRSDLVTGQGEHFVQEDDDSAAIACEFEGGITRTIDGFTGFKSPLIKACR